MPYKQRLKALIFIFITVLSAQSFTFYHHEEEEKPTNLKLLPKDISEEELHTVMREYSRALGVKCGYCHERKEGQKHADFASDAKEEKLITRGMMQMVNDINEKYLSSIGKGHFEKIACVTCHMGRPLPIISVDSLPKKTAKNIAPNNLPLPKADSTKAPEKTH